MSRSLRSAVLLVLVLAAGTGAWVSSLRGAGNSAARGARNGASADVPVSVAVAQRSDFPIIRRTIGWVEPIAVVNVKARLDSVIETQNVKDGDFVKAGDVLFKLDSREVEAQIAKDEANLARDKALLVRAQADLVRKQDLVGKGVATPQMVDQAKADEGSAAATVKADDAALALDRVKLSYATITAPISGRVGTILVTPGNVVRANDATANLLTITQISPIRVSFTLPERDLAALQDVMHGNKPASVHVFASGDSHPLATGTVTFLDSAVDIPSGTITVKATFANAEMMLWPGQYLDVALEISTVANATVVPTVAVQPGQTSPFVYVVKPDSTVDVRAVDVTASEGDRTAISRGLEPGERVVVDGQSRIVPGARVRVTDGAMPATDPQASKTARS